MRSIYSKKLQICIRVLSLLTTIILIITEINLLNNINSIFNYPIDIFLISLNAISIILFIFVFLFPAKIGLLSIITFLYGTLLLIYKPENDLGLLMFIFSLIILYSRGFFKRNRLLKEFLFILSFFFIMIVKYSICDVIFIDFFIENTIKSILFLLFFCFLHAYTIHFIKSQPFI